MSEYTPAFTTKLLAGAYVGLLWYAVASAGSAGLFLVVQRGSSIPGVETIVAIGLSMTLIAVFGGFLWGSHFSSEREEDTFRVRGATFVLLFFGIYLTGAVIATVVVDPDFWDLTAAYGVLHLVSVAAAFAVARWLANEDESLLF